MTREVQEAVTGCGPWLVVFVCPRRISGAAVASHPQHDFSGSLEKKAHILAIFSCIPSTLSVKSEENVGVSCALRAKQSE